ncbi:Gfo/Idh/MocA family protein [Bosea sp. PAMC 26642]|uniref:Gfo/Idh/MocA family protein n=1 Tax=Bosea sp. (strain PAMC 26642) TaxID=1792307 RepID=UPI0007700633|nr:Gfo/Idh/MocA family oxidoreductase [Bosea sp. PAMC 26642]AMJ61438.1 galactose 1-dehydrogenase [Bosea sp. PAMC 26642]
MTMLRLAIVGLGKIARDQHLPAVAGLRDIAIAAVVSRNATLDGVPCFETLEELFASNIAVDAVALCTPPQVRRAQAALALAAGKHVMLEKPPGATVSELAPLIATARGRGLTLFATWHSRHAPAVEPARALLAANRPLSVKIDWREDVRVWHPGQDWIFEAGGLGVFDPGINALSILTRILPRPVFLRAAGLAFPANREAPIAAELDLADETGLPIRAEFDFLQSGPQSWDMRIETEGGTLMLSAGGAKLDHDGRALVDEPEAEYPALYRRFVHLVSQRESDVDLAPLQLVADAFLLGKRRGVEAFTW